MLHAEYRFQALWTLCEIQLEAESGEIADKIFEEIYQFVGNFEGEFSRFRGNSSLSMLNTTGSLEVSERFLALLELSKNLYTETNRYFDPLCDIRTAGYTLSFDTGVFEERLADRKYFMEEIQIEGNRVTLPKGAYLDFWAIGKWFCIDEVATILEAHGVEIFIVNFWGDIRAKGKRWWEWPVTGIASSDGIFGTLRLQDCSIATSGSYIRSWKNANGETQHHLVNPLDKQFEKKIVSLSVIHQKAAVADALATALFVMWEQKALEFAREKNMDCLIILSDGSSVSSKDFEEKFSFVRN